MSGNCILPNLKTANALYNFSHWLTERMKESETTCADLAQYIGVERKTILAFKNAQRFPKLDHLVLIFDFFDKKTVIVPFSSLVFLEETDET